MREVNGVIIGDPEEQLAFPDHFPEVPDDKTAIFGFRLDEEGLSPKWVHATEEDYRSVRTKLGLTKEEIDAEVGQRTTLGPTCSYNGRLNYCVGDCVPGGLPCTTHWDPTNLRHVLYCACG